MVKNTRHRKSKKMEIPCQFMQWVKGDLDEIISCWYFGDDKVKKPIY